MARKLKEEVLEDENDSVTVAEKDITAASGMSTSKTVKTHRGEEATIQAEGFDLNVLDQFKPYHEDEVLPRPISAKNAKGQVFVKKHAEPRFYFEGSDFLKVQMGLHGKKTSLFWRYKENIPVHKKIRSYLRRKGMTGA